MRQIDRPRACPVKTNEGGASHRDGGHHEAEQKHGLVAENLCEPPGEPRHGENAGPEREPPEHLHEAEFPLDLLQRLRGAIRMRALDHLRGHSVGNHVLQHDADDDEELRHDIERILAGEADPAAGGAGENDEARGDERGSHIHIGPALGAEHRHGIDELAEDHLDGPGQREPNGDGSKLCRRQSERFLDPERLGDGDEAERAIGVIDHEQRQIAEPHGADRRENRVPQLLKERVPGGDLR